MLRLRILRRCLKSSRIRLLKKMRIKDPNNLGKLLVLSKPMLNLRLRTMLKLRSLFTTVGRTMPLKLSIVTK